jgi:cobalt-zinc-cadmium efflux system outer membrane protein
MPSRAPVCAWIAACALVVPPAALAQELSAPDVVGLVVREGPRAIAIRAEVDVVRSEQAARLAFPNPAFAFSREGAGFTEFLQVEQPLPIFGVRAVLARAGVAATSAADAERDARLSDLRAEAARLAARLLADQARVEATTADVVAVRRLVEVLRVREREGEGSRFDRLRAQQELEDVKLTAVNASVAAAETRGLLAALLPSGRTLTRVTGDLFEERRTGDVEAIVARADESRAELRALRFAAERADQEAEAARRARLPQPIVNGGLKRAGDGSERTKGGVFGVSLTLPLFDSGRREAARWIAERARVAAERTALAQQIRAEITRAAEALRLRQEALASGPDGMRSGELIGAAEVAYREGDVGILALLDAVRTSSRARLRDIDMRLDARLAQVALEHAAGGVVWP